MLYVIFHKLLQSLRQCAHNQRFVTLPSHLQAANVSNIQRVSVPEVLKVEITGT